MIGSRVGIIGLGRLGKLLGQILRDDVQVSGFDANPAKMQEFPGAAPLAEVAASDTLFFCVPISRLEAAVDEALPYLRNDAFVLDVCSVKLKPVEILTRRLPPGVRLLPTHPMFGPDSWPPPTNDPVSFVLCPTDRTPQRDYESVAEYLEKKHVKVVRMTPDEHDRTMAYSLCLTHLLGRAVEPLGLTRSDTDTGSFRGLLEIQRIACNDTFELFRDMETENPYAAEMRQRLRAALNDLERELTGA